MVAKILFLLEEFKWLSDELYYVFSYQRFHLVPYFVFGQRFVYSVYHLPLLLRVRPGDFSSPSCTTSALLRVRLRYDYFV